MTLQVPSNKPHLPASVAKEASQQVSKETQKQDQVSREQTVKPIEPKLSNVGRGPELDSHAIAVRLAAMATKAKELEKSREFKEILEKLMAMTGLTEPEAAVAEASRRLQEEIETELERIQANKDLMEEAEDWEKFAELLANMGEETAEGLLVMLKESIREL